MKTKKETKSFQAFEVRLWSKKHFGLKGNKARVNIYDGVIINLQTKKRKFFHSIGDLLLTIERGYSELEGNENGN
jgi:hypothetical protein